MTASLKPGALKPLRQTSDLRLYDRLFVDTHSYASRKDLLQSLKPNRLQLGTAHVKPSLAGLSRTRNSKLNVTVTYIADRVDHKSDKPIFNLAVGLKDSWETRHDKK